MLHTTSSCSNISCQRGESINSIITIRIITSITITITSMISITIIIRGCVLNFNGFVELIVSGIVVE